MSDTQFPEDSWVQVRYPLTVEQERGDRSAWPWLPTGNPTVSGKRAVGRS